MSSYNDLKLNDFMTISRELKDANNKDFSEHIIADESSPKAEIPIEKLPGGQFTLNQVYSRDGVELASSSITFIRNTPPKGGKILVSKEDGTDSSGGSLKGRGMEDVFTLSTSGWDDDMSSDNLK